MKKYIVLVCIFLSISFLLGCQSEQEKALKYDQTILENLKVLGKCDDQLKGILLQATKGEKYSESDLVDTAEAMTKACKNIKKLNAPAVYDDAQKKFLAMVKDYEDVLSYLPKLDTSDARLGLGISMIMVEEDKEKGIHAIQDVDPNTIGGER